MNQTYHLGGHPVVHTHSFALLPRPAWLAAARARRRLYREIRRIAPYLAHGGYPGSRQLMRMELRWHAPIGDDHSRRLHSIAAHALKLAAATGLTTAATAQILCTTHRSSAADARIEVSIHAAYPSPRHR
ncbi:hypothetical protein ACFWPH_28330 [Nocardia sp. NPDC058499]|uniref:hypothetical protein n=1 Tax=Nocardia sp. NPDC058499 TaxID=3346530 RepID=UPI00364E5C39